MTWFIDKLVHGTKYEKFCAILIFGGLFLAFLFAAISGFWRNVLLKYIKKTDYEKWKKLTAFPMNGFLKFQESEENTGDPVMNEFRLKFQRYRKYTVLALAVALIGVLLRLLD
jgi:hypothetical protein